MSTPTPCPGCGTKTSRERCIGCRHIFGDELAMTPTHKPMEGTWTLIAPDGRQWQAESPLRCVSLEQQERVSADVALARIMAAAREPIMSTPTHKWRAMLNCAHDLLWRLRCTYHYRVILGWGLSRCWELAGESLSQQKEWRALGLGFDSPSVAVADELTCWSD